MRNFVFLVEMVKIQIHKLRFILQDQIPYFDYLVLAPEHPLLSSVVSEAQQNIVEEYQEVASRKSDLERTELPKDKSGFFSGSYARNPVNGEAIPILVAVYVLGSYGTGAIMDVPAHDSCDHEFAVKYNIPIHWVVTADECCNEFEKPYSGEGDAISSSSLTSGLEINGLHGKFQIERLAFCQATLLGRTGETETIRIPEMDLPLTLPELDDFTPTGTGDPPLSKRCFGLKL